ncbi:MAG: ClpP family protease, partial [Minisyncoccota bacterium]
ESMASRNSVFLNGSINDAMYQKVITEYETAMQGVKVGDNIRLYINSPGGNTYTSLALYDLFLSCPYPVHGTVQGRAGSMAPIVLQGCKVRRITKNSAIMLHLQTVTIEGNVPDARASIEEFARLDDLMVGIIAEKTRRPLEEVRALMARDTHFDAKSALQFGLVDEIV